MFNGVCFVVSVNYKGVWEDFVTEPKAVFTLTGTFLVCLLLIDWIKIIFKK
jgi:hypothetical protein